jgi:hypothetical protein
MISKNTFDIELNQPPINGSCSIDPWNGTMMTSFNINCSNWFDQDEIKDYSVYGFVILSDYFIYLLINIYFHRLDK